MHSDLISKIEKARHYADEPERVCILELKAQFHGSNGEHLVTLSQSGEWFCDSPAFQNWGTSPHIIAMQKLLEPMLSPEARQPAEAIGVHMHSEMISKVEKARRYAEQPERVKIFELTARFRGDNNEHVLTYRDGSWHSEEAFFRNWGTSSHIMALQRMLSDMLPTEALQPEFMSVNTPTETASI